MIVNTITYRTYLTVANQLQWGGAVSYRSVALNFTLEYAFLQSSKDFIK